MIRKSLVIPAILLFVTNGISQNLLNIPDTLSGTAFNLNIKDSSKVFYTGYTTKTFGVNSAYFGPTLFLNKGDSVNIQVNNMLMDTTTLHWHGLHVSAKNDGGPHITIPPATSWFPGFKIRNKASMFWYHSHLHMMTNLHASLGVAGLIIVRDTLEAKLNLPRRYGTDDFPLVIQSKCFDSAKQMIINNAYDSVMMVNGTIDPYLPAPAQVIRLRLLNASSERVYNIGFQGNLSFAQIGTDGGLLNAPVTLTRLRIAPGERYEILIDLTGKSGQVINLMSFASQLPNGVYGALQPGMGAGQVIPGYSANVLNGADFKIMTFSVAPPTSSPIHTVPASLVVNTPWLSANANGFRTLTFTPANQGPGAIQGPFLINSASFDMDVVNFSIPFNNIEVWTLTNQSPISHPFHIHDTQFYITEINAASPPANLAGPKDVVLVPAGQTVKFITRFENFCDEEAMYMYHCHMLTHEDKGMMGQFVVTCPPVTDVGFNETAGEEELILYPNPANDKITVSTVTAGIISEIRLFDLYGKLIFIKKNPGTQSVALNISEQPAGIYIIEIKTGNKSVYKKINILH